MIRAALILVVLLFSVPACAADPITGEPVSGKPVAGDAAWAAGETFRDCPNCPEMVVVPAGDFTMGSNGRHKFEIPAHPVAIAKPFAMGKFEVTFNEWKACMREGGCSHLPDDHKWGRGKRPIINITWAEARKYAAWLARTTGKPYRLPSEAEWEYAARAGTTTEFSWGDAPGTNLANCRNCKSQWSKKGTAPVGSFKANPFGLYDMHGNVWEWIEDCWNTSYIGAPSDGRARTDGICTSHIIRSGSWYYFSKNARSAWRFKNDARVKSYNIGMRVVRDLP